jgi:hypothetical protein
VKAIDGTVRDLRERGVPMTHLVTIMPSSGDSSERKRSCTCAVGHIGQALKRHGKPHVGLTIFEHPINADLHAHHLVHVHPGERQTLERFSDPPEVEVQRIRNLPHLLGYVTKQRQRLPPDFEKRIDRPWQRCRPVPGKRWTMTGDAKAVLSDAAMIVKPRPPNNSAVSTAENVSSAPANDLGLGADCERRALAMDATLRLTLAACAGASGLYDLTLDGELLVSRSRDPEHDAARALRDRGYTGKFWTVDAKTGSRRMLVDIAKAARLTVIDGAAGLSVKRWRPFPKGISRGAVVSPARQNDGVATLLAEAE